MEPGENAQQAEVARRRFARQFLRRVVLGRTHLTPRQHEYALSVLEVVASMTDPDWWYGRRDATMRAILRDIIFPEPRGWQRALATLAGFLAWCWKRR
jgi:hypothetical protein